MFKTLKIADITVPERLRNVDEDHALAIQASIVEHGLLNPITVRATPNGKQKYALVAGAHRLRAMALLAEPQIDTLVVKADADEAVLIEIEENLFRNDLSVMDRAVFVETHRDVWERSRGKIKRGNPQLGQVDPIAASPLDLVAQEAATGFSKVCAERLGISEAAVKRLNRIAQNLPREVRQAISGTPIADNQSQLLKLAKLEPAKRAKAHIAIKESDGDFKAAIALLDPPPAARQDPEAQFLSRLIDTWERAKPATRRKFLEYANLFDGPEGDEA
jgi:ParB family transcriptional regulator, chromosome partitioning protein